LGLAVVRNVDITGISLIEIFDLVCRISTSTILAFSNIELRFKSFSVSILVVSFSGEVYFGISVSGTFFVNRYVFVAAGRARTSVAVDVDLFLSVCSGSWALPFKSSIFPSDARSTC